MYSFFAYYKILSKTTNMAHVNSQIYGDIFIWNCKKKKFEDENSNARKRCFFVLTNTNMQILCFNLFMGQFVKKIPPSNEHIGFDA